MADNITNNKIVTTVELDVNVAAQEIVKLNSLASDGTKDLSERLDAKNKQIKIQNDLNKKGISDLEKQVKGLKGVVGKEKEYIKATQKLEKAKLNEVKVTERNAKTQRKLAESYDKSKGAINKLDNATGGMITRFKLLAANPIVLFVTILTAGLQLLKKAFTSSEEGQDRYAKAMAVIGSIVDNLMDVVAGLSNVLVDAFTKPQETVKDLAKAIKKNFTNRIESAIEMIGFLGSAIKKVFTGDFGGAMDDANKAGSSYVDTLTGVKDTINKTKNALQGFTEAVIADGIVAGQIADQRALADKIDRDLIVARAKANRDRADALNKSIDKEKYNVLERIEFLKEAGRIEDEITNKEIESAKIRLQAKVDENGLALSNKEALEQEAILKARIIELETAKLTKLKEVTGQIVAFNAEAKAASDKVIADQKAIDDTKLKEEEEAKKVKKEKELADAEADRGAQLELDELEIQRKRDLGERTLALELELLEKKRLQDTNVAGLTAKEIEVINAKSAKAKKDIKDQEAKTDEAINKAILDAGINMAADAFGIAQEVAVAKMLMAAPEALGNVWKNAAAQPTIPQMLLHGAVGTATTISPIIKGLKQIKQTRFSKKSKSGRSGGGGGSISAPTAGATPVGVSDIANLSGSNASRMGTDSSLSSRASADAVNGGTLGGASSGIVFSENSYSDFRSQVDFKEDKTTI